MDLKEKITLDMLTKDSVSVLRQQFINYGGVDMQVGENVRNAYSNNEDDRALLKNILSEEYYNAVMAVWGDSPTVDEPTEDEPTESEV